MHLLLVICLLIVIFVVVVSRLLKCQLIAALHVEHDFAVGALRRLLVLHVSVGTLEDETPLRIIVQVGVVCIVVIAIVSQIVAEHVQLDATRDVVDVALELILVVSHAKWRIRSPSNSDMMRFVLFFDLGDILYNRIEI